MDGSNAALLLLAGAIFISLIIERFLEIVKSCYDVLEAKYNFYKFWNRQAANLQENLEALIEKSTVLNLANQLGADRVKIKEVAYEKCSSISVAQLRTFVVKYAAKVLGIIIGIVVAWVANIDMFLLIDNLMSGVEKSASSYPWLTITLTGVSMGMGSGPLHKIIASMEKAKQTRVSRSE
ncbi:hypothetical protein [Halioxenophilus sp. WMMB6]|uniref:hypothetical protein n=1 Tax=Halioxenophilus sp. WMMB6 TaxID=3073815 RepID=UPI00295EB9B5|nr:hypothetical protein [Halioxenophilus sp. WMMB6]